MQRLKLAKHHTNSRELAHLVHGLHVGPMKELLCVRAILHGCRPLSRLSMPVCCFQLIVMSPWRKKTVARSLCSGWNLGEAPYTI